MELNMKGMEDQVASMSTLMTSIFSSMMSIHISPKYLVHLQFFSFLFVNFIFSFLTSWLHLDTLLKFHNIKYEHGLFQHHYLRLRCILQEISYFKILNIFKFFSYNICLECKLTIYVNWRLQLQLTKELHIKHLKLWILFWKYIHNICGNMWGCIHLNGLNV